VAPFLTLGSHRAIQSEPRSPSSHPESSAQSDELAAYDIALRQRGSLTVWFTEAAIAAWKAGHAARVAATALLGVGDHHGADAAAVFRLALRQTEGLIASLLGCLVLISQRRPFDDQPTGRDIAGVADHEPAAKRSTCWWTAQVSSFAVPVSGWPRSTPQGRLGPGESSISGWTPTRTDHCRRADRQRMSMTGSQSVLLEQIARPVASFTGDGRQ